MSIEDRYTETVTVKRKVETKDGQGSWTTVLNDLIIGMPCHIWPLTGREQDDFMKREVIADYGLMATPQSQAITEKDVVVQGTVEYDVVFVISSVPKAKYIKLLLQLRK